MQTIARLRSIHTIRLTLRNDYGEILNFRDQLTPSHADLQYKSNKVSMTLMASLLASV